MTFIFRSFIWCFLTTGVASGTESPKEILLERAKAKRLGESLEWQKILYYDPNMVGIRRSMVDAPAFFMASDGKYHPQNELTATIEAIFRPLGATEKQDQHPVCRYPRRIAWIKKNLGLRSEDLPKVTCSDYEYWLQGKNFEGISLVFSSSYPNNPSSLFGHTFLRMHRSQREQRTKILDDAINFSAFPDTDNPLLYSLRGLMGGFPGHFSFTPYYLKVQEYSNADSRDLWEYRLNFSQEDLQNVLYALWEMGPHRIDYFYFDENCSMVIQHFLEAAKPELNLTHLQFWVIPADTVKQTTAVPHLIEDVVYRPSALSRFLAKYRALPEASQRDLDEIVEANQSSQSDPLLAKYPSEQRAELMDAVLEYIDFYERLAGSGEAQTYGVLRAKLLSERTKLPTLTPKPVPVPRDEQPDTGHDSSRLGLEAGVMGLDEGFVQYHWRPALHDKLSSDRGYSAGLGIDFFDFYLRHRPREKKIDINEFKLIQITSLPRLEPIVKRPAWNFSLGSILDYSCAYDGLTIKEESADPCRTYFIKSGVGLSGPWTKARLLGYSMASLALGENFALRGGVYAEPSLDTGVIWSPIETLKVQGFVINRVLKGRFGSANVRHTFGVKGGFQLQRNHELRASAFVESTKYREILGSYYFYF